MAEAAMERLAGSYEYHAPHQLPAISVRAIGQLTNFYSGQKVASLYTAEQSRSLMQGGESMLRHNHYEVAFEEYLRFRRMPYVAVDESRRACWREGSLKSLDFIVYSQRRPNLLVDVKGRRWGGPQRTHTWENWANTDDIESLRHWQDVFGPGFRAVLIFAYDLVSPAAREYFPDRFSLGNRDYAFYCVGVDEYAEGMRQRSRGWQTVSLSRSQYRQLRTPLEQVL